MGNIYEIVSKNPVGRPDHYLILRPDILDLQSNEGSTA